MRRLLFLLPLLMACDTRRDAGDLFGPAVENTLVIDATLLVDQPLPDLFVWRTLAPHGEYSRQRAAVTDARVAVGAAGAAWSYRADPDSAGRYLPPPDAPQVQPQREYQLEVTSTLGTARARTLTPARLTLHSAVVLDAATLTVQRHLRVLPLTDHQAWLAAENQIRFREGVVEIRVVPEPGRFYQLALFNLEEDSEFLIDEGFLGEDSADAFNRAGASPPVRATDGRVRLPWFAIAFAGRHVARVYSIDRNWYDYARSTVPGGAFGELAGDGFERPLFNVDGGIGLFGSASVVDVPFNVLPRAGE